ncbi:DHA2 family efflux MFS transporter permease subunit [Actinomadura harenae]|uniref:DHA2 family efflux MFS transporter permease subunit n=1 Tax=Actinomadura harenae TaxID=2483351 RepID=A0A3M2MAL9_9ACTN|nr:DHA2 family efflux MFS transporter permease subunit [Actinomadura harenae]RMI45913.1 DHA2 family efflux MFS transporter permease subunit [Actinomadura harenae]
MTETALSPPPERRGLSPALLRLAGVITLASLMMQLDMTMTGVATRTLLHRFGTTLGTVQWVTTGYLLAMAVVVPVAGWGMERFGARAVWLTSLVVFLIGSVACGSAWSIGSLIAFRVVQGLGGGLILPLAHAIAAREAGSERLGRMTAAIAVPSLLGPVLGPVLGGWIVDDLDWRWIFFVNVPVCLVALVLSARAVPADRGDARAPLDVLGLVLLAGGCAALVFGCAEGGRLGSVTGPRVLTSLAAGAALLAAYLAHALRGRTVPIIDPRLFRSGAFAGPAAGILLATVLMFGALGLLPLYFQQARGEDALHTGLLVIPFGAGMGVALAACGLLADRVPPRPLGVAGAVLTGAGGLLLTRLDAATGTVTIGVAQALYGAGVGALLVTILTAGMRGVAPEAIPRASTALRILQQLGGAFGSALLFVVLQRRELHHPGADAFGHTFRWVVAFSGLTLVAALFLPSRRR